MKTNRNSIFLLALVIAVLSCNKEKGTGSIQVPQGCYSCGGNPGAAGLLDNIGATARVEQEGQRTFETAALFNSGAAAHKNGMSEAATARLADAVGGSLSDNKNSELTDSSLSGGGAGGPLFGGGRTGGGRSAGSGNSGGSGSSSGSGISVAGTAPAISEATGQGQGEGSGKAGLGSASGSNGTGYAAGAGGGAGGSRGGNGGGFDWNSMATRGLGKDGQGQASLLSYGEGGAGRGPASANGSGSSEDPADYFSRLKPTDSIFKVVERRYTNKAEGWALTDARHLAGSSTENAGLAPAKTAK